MGSNAEDATTMTHVGPTDAAIAAAVLASPAKAPVEPLPLSMTYTSLEWMADNSAAPTAPEETPPTSPEKARRGSGSGTRASETDEQRRQRQAAFIREKNRELELWRQKKEAGLLPDVEDDDAADASGEAASVAPVTPVRKARPAAGSSSDSSAAVQQLVSPEKRRAKKLSSLQYPIFSVCWWDFPPRSAAANAATEADASSAAAAAASSSSSGAAEPASLGLVLLGGGGGKKGAGVDSGMLVCSVLPPSASVFSLGSTPIRMSSASCPRVALHPTAFLDSNDFLIGHMAPHPSRPVIAATVGAGTAILEAQLRSPNSLSDDDPTQQLSGFIYRDMMQTDWSKDLNAQAQAWSPSGSWLVTGGEDKVLRVWAFPSLVLRAVLGSDAAGNPRKEQQHRNCILSLDVNHDGTRVASCAGDGAVKIWDTSRLGRATAAGADASEENDEDDGLSESERAAWSQQSTLVRCPLVKDVTIPALKGYILKFQVAKFYGKTKITQKSEGNKKAAQEEEEESKEEEAEEEEEGEGEDAEQGDEFLIAIASQIRRGSPSASSLIKFRGSEDFGLVKQLSTGSAALTTMEISDDTIHPFVALANTDGQVAIYETQHMKCIKRVNKCHESVTAAASSEQDTKRRTVDPSRLFTAGAAPSSPASTRWLLSASADKSCALIDLPPAGQRSSQRKIIFFAIALLLLIIAIALGKEPWLLPESDL